MPLVLPILNGVSDVQLKVTARHYITAALKHFINVTRKHLLWSFFCRVAGLSQSSFFPSISANILLRKCKASEFCPKYTMGYWLNFEWLKKWLLKTCTSLLLTLLIQSEVEVFLVLIFEQFYAIDLFLYFLKSLENLLLSDVFRECRKRSVEWNRLP